MGEIEILTQLNLQLMLAISNIVQAYDRDDNVALEGHITAAELLIQ